MKTRKEGPSRVTLPFLKVEAGEADMIDFDFENNLSILDTVPLVTVVGFSSALFR